MARGQGSVSPLHAVLLNCCEYFILTTGAIVAKRVWPSLLSDAAVFVRGDSMPDQIHQVRHRSHDF